MDYFVDTIYARGAEWRKWDLHIHTPASFHWNGQRFDPTNPTANRALIDEMIAALNAAEPAVFALMDYWTFDGWFALKQRLSEPNSPKLLKKVFPGIELRLMAPMKGRLNAHVLFSDHISKQMLDDFKAALNVELINRPLSNDSLIALARKVGDDKLKGHGLKKAEVDADDNEALRGGSIIAEINCDSYKNAISKVPEGMAIGFMPFNTNDGLTEVNWLDHYAFCLGLFNSSPIFETRDIDTWGAFVGDKTTGNQKWFDNFQKALNDTPRLAVSGSDAHQFVGVKGDNDHRGYGDYPSNKATWIKADPTFLGLLQAIKEPAKRSFIGEIPPKLQEVQENKTFFIEKVAVNKIAGSVIPEEWLSGTSISLNKDLVAIIGNKGSGKSALADIIALLGNSRQKSHFSFLKKDRFRGKSGDPAKQFLGEITWLNGTPLNRNLNEDPSLDQVEMIRYIPQNHFEELCNDHVSGRTSAFENELRAVIFDHASDSIRLGALDFDQLIDQQESTYRDELNEYRKELIRLNNEIEALEDQSQLHVKKSLEELLVQKKKQIDEHVAIKPLPLPKPSEQLSEEQQQAAIDIDAISTQLKEIDLKITSNNQSLSSFALKLRAVQSIKDRVRLLERQFEKFNEETRDDFMVLEFDPAKFISLNVNLESLDSLELSIPVEQQNISENTQTLNEQRQSLLVNQTNIKTKLNEPQLQYQLNLKALEQWNLKLNELNGTADAPDTLNGLEARLAQLALIPEQLNVKQKSRLNLTGEIFDTLDAQRHAREELFKPVQDLIQSNVLIRDEYKLQFQATLGGSSDVLASELFALIKQNSGEFRGEDESYATIKRLSEQYDLGKREDVLSFVSELDQKIHSAASGGATGIVGVGSILRKDRSASSVYDLLYGLSYMEPRYSLLFQDTQIEQLSPGQRGALLLIFYLLVDKGRNPIILDQPEENLDNETVVSLLVPVLTEAKKKRQIIMVTHNPNLAVVCDAEQVIYSFFDRKNQSKINYYSGSIENPHINQHVVDVLEGTKRAFDNRKIKYH